MTRKTYSKIITALLVLVSVCVLIVSGCGKSKKDTASSSATETTSAAAATTASGTQKMTAEVNYKYLNLIGCGYDDIIDTFGEAESENPINDDILELVFSNNSIKVEMYTDDEEANPGRSNEVWLIQTNAGELFSMSENSSMTENDFLAALKETSGDVSDSSHVKGGLIDTFQFGKNTDDVLKFECEGYTFQIVTGSDGKIDSSSTAVVVLQAEKEIEESESTDAEEEE